MIKSRSRNIKTEEYSAKNPEDQRPVLSAACLCIAHVNYDSRYDNQLVHYTGIDRGRGRGRVWILVAEAEAEFGRFSELFKNKMFVVIINSIKSIFLQFDAHSIHIILYIYYIS